MCALKIEMKIIKSVTLVINGILKKNQNLAHATNAS